MDELQGRLGDVPRHDHRAAGILKAAGSRVAGQRGRALAAALLVAVVVLIAGAPWLLGLQARHLHDTVVAELQGTGLVSLRGDAYQPGWQNSATQGEFDVVVTACRACPRLRFDGQFHHGPLTLIRRSGLAVAQYRIGADVPALDPPPPDVTLDARKPWTAPAQIALAMPASRHRYRGREAWFAVAQQGLSGTVSSGRLDLNSPGLSVERDRLPALSAEAVRLAVLDRDEFQLDLNADRLHIAPLAWQGHQAHLGWQHRSSGRRLDIDFELGAEGGSLAGQDHAASRTVGRIERLDLPAMRALIRDLRGLLGDNLPPALRALGWMGLYSNHGPAFFAAAPKLELDAAGVPVPEGLADLDLELEVKQGIRQPPLAPRQWLAALDGNIDLRVPEARMRIWTDWLGRHVGRFLGLPRSYAEFYRAGWIETLDDGRERLALRLADGHIEPAPPLKAVAATAGEGQTPGS